MAVQLYVGPDSIRDEGFTFHSLRHTFATELFNQGRRPKIIQSLLGHSSIVQTMDTYSHLLEDVDDETRSKG